MQYIRQRRTQTVSARVTVADRRLLEAAAAASGATVSAYIAEISTSAARRELVDNENEPEQVGMILRRMLEDGKLPALREALLRQTPDAA